MSIDGTVEGTHPQGRAQFEVDVHLRCGTCAPMASLLSIKTFFVAAVVVGGALAVGCSSEAGDPEADDDISDEAADALVSKACGARLGDTCGKGEYCRFSMNAICGRADQTGRCTRLPKSCPSAKATVCGCDGRTFRNACRAHAAGTSVLSQGACAPVCDPALFEKVVAPTLAEIKGFWSRREVVGYTETVEELSLRSDASYKLRKVVGPYCTPGGLCPKFVTRFYQSQGTFDALPGSGVQLHPDAFSSAELPENFGVEKSCAPSLRLTTTEGGVAVVLTKEADRCVEDAECTTKNLGPNTLACIVGESPTKACDADSSTCQWACKAPAAPTTCPAGQKKCLACGAAPPDGICRAFVCVAAGAPCPLFQ